MTLGAFVYIGIGAVFFGMIFSSAQVEKAGAMAIMALFWPLTLLVVLGMWLARDWS